MPPLWAAAAIVLLGWNEFLAVLYNPLWLFMGLVFFLFGKVKAQSSYMRCRVMTFLSGLQHATRRSHSGAKPSC